MAIEFCPLEADWGNIADWAAVVVGFGAAIATIFVATAANRTSRQAAKIAEDAKDIAGQQHDEAVKLREGTARILGSLLCPEILVVPTKLSVVIRSLDEVLQNGVAEPENRNQTEWILAELQLTFLPSTEESLDRLHNLPEGLGDDLAQVVGLCRGLIDSAERIDKRFYRIKYKDQKLIAQYLGDPTDFDALRTQLEEALISSLGVARSFAVFAKVNVPDYTNDESVVKRG